MTSGDPPLRRRRISGSWGTGRRRAHWGGAVRRVKYRVHVHSRLRVQWDWLTRV